jgi:hypothetical protein
MDQSKMVNFDEFKQNVVIRKKCDDGENVAWMSLKWLNVSKKYPYHLKAWAAEPWGQGGQMPPLNFLTGGIAPKWKCECASNEPQMEM